MNIVFIAGEASGDAIAAKVMKILPQSCTISGVGGNQMIANGFKSIFPISQISVMGFIEIICHLPKIITLINQTVAHILTQKPDKIVTFDSPGFAMAVAKKLRKLNYQGNIIHVVAPTVWAYKKKRAQKFAKYFNQMLCLFPFEPEYFIKANLPAKFVGNASIEEYRDSIFQHNNATNALQINTIAITLGSRLGEIKKHIKVIVKIINQICQNNESINFIFPTLPSLKSYIQNYIDQFCEYEENVTIIDTPNAIDEVMHSCDVAIAKSGTNTIQFLANLKPIIVYYKINWISYFIIKSMIKIPFVNLVNIIAKREIVPELIQSRATPNNIILALKDITPLKRQEITEILKQMFNPNGKLPSTIIAETILEQRITSDTLG